MQANDETNDESLDEGVLKDMGCVSLGSNRGGGVSSEEEKCCDELSTWVRNLIVSPLNRCMPKDKYGTTKCLAIAVGMPTGLSIWNGHPFIHCALKHLTFIRAKLSTRVNAASSCSNIQDEQIRDREESLESCRFSANGMCSNSIIRRGFVDNRSNLMRFAVARRGNLVGFPGQFLAQRRLASALDVSLVPSWHTHEYVWCISSLSSEIFPFHEMRI
jgi:hypothetical protein